MRASTYTNYHQLNSTHPSPTTIHTCCLNWLPTDAAASTDPPGEVKNAAAEEEAGLLNPPTLGLEALGEVRPRGPRVGVACVEEVDVAVAEELLLIGRLVAGVMLEM
jgi:hypothetical protein